MSISICAFAVVLLGVIFYCWFLSAEQRRLTRSVEMLNRLQEQNASSQAPNERAA